MADRPDDRRVTCPGCGPDRRCFTADYDEQAAHLPKPAGYAEGDTLRVICCVCSWMIRLEVDDA